MGGRKRGRGEEGEERGGGREGRGKRKGRGQPPIFWPRTAPV